MKKLRKPEMGHGNRTTYGRGCRCEPCRQANLDYKRHRRKLNGKPFMALPKETVHPSLCAVCLSPIAVHVPYWKHA